MTKAVLGLIKVVVPSVIVVALVVWIFVAQSCQQRESTERANQIQEQTQEAEEENLERDVELKKYNKEKEQRKKEPPSPEKKKKTLEGMMKVLKT